MRLCVAAIEAWVNATYDDPAVKDWAWGSAVHWYSDPATRGVALNRTHLSHPTKPILHTEACVCPALCITPAFLALLLTRAAGNCLLSTYRVL